MSTKMKTKRNSLIKLKVKTTAVNEASGTVTLEGTHDDVVYMILIDYDIFNDKSFQEHREGDQYTLSMKYLGNFGTDVEAKLTPGRTVCLGSGKKVKMTRGNYNRRETCPKCKKAIFVNFGGNVFRKHYA